MNIWIMTLFPEYFSSFVEYGVVGNFLRKSDKVKINFVQIRDFSPKDYKGVDDSPYGGGPGMVMRADVLKTALDEGILKKGGYSSLEELHIVYTAPQGKTWDHETCKSFMKKNINENKDLVFICGRYEGIDQRFLDKYVNQTISIGDFVLTGGELAVMTILDSSMRFYPDVLGNKESAIQESFFENLLEHPQYTRPSEFEGESVPKILLSGDHKKIDEFRKSESLKRTKKYRPDLLEKN